MEIVIAYYAGPFGLEMYEMQRIDFNEAKERFPDLWSLEKPTDPKVAIKDMTPLKLDIGRQVEVESKAPISPPITKRRNPGLNPI